MNARNYARISGALGRDAELRKGERGQIYLYVSIAVHGDTFRGSDGVLRNRVDWIPCFAFSQTLLDEAPNLVKGSLITVVGEVTARGLRMTLIEQLRPPVREAEEAPSVPDESFD